MLTEYNKLQGAVMQGILAFASLEEAVRAGFTLYDRAPWGYLVRAHTPGGWALAIVKTRKA